MGIDVEGKMLLGAWGCELTVPEEFNKDLTLWLLEEKDLEVASPYYDACPEDCFYGFLIQDAGIDEMDEKWLSTMKDLGQKFFDITGVKATLGGFQHVW